MDQSPLIFDDPDSITRHAGLSVVRSRAESVEPFSMELFAGFTSMKALTYTASLPMIVGLLRDNSYKSFECVFGHGGILPPDVSDVLAFQAVMDEKLSEAFVVAETSDERRQALFDRVAADKARFFVVKDHIAHAKIYLLEREGLRRAIVGSANLSETAFSGRQAETLVAYDNDDIAWGHFFQQYEAVRSVATSHLAPRREPIPAHLLPIDEIPAAKQVKAADQDVQIFVPAESEEEVEVSIPTVMQRVVRVAEPLRTAMASVRPDRNGKVILTHKIIREAVTISRARHKKDEEQNVSLTYNGRKFYLSGNEMSLEASEDDIRGDVERWLEFFGNYENGFKGDVSRLQQDYFTFMCWFYFAPLLCDVRNFALRSGKFSFDQPMFAVLYGSSNCGKTSLIETLMHSMFDHPRIVEADQFTASNLRALRGAFRRFPVIFDDVTRERFGRHAEEAIKHDHIPSDEYPCFALSMNKDTRSFKDEVVKRCLMIYTRTSLPGNETSARYRLQRSIAKIREGMTTALYREYLKRAIDRMEALREGSADSLADADVLELSSQVLCDLFGEHAPDGLDMPDWLRPMTLNEYQQRAWDRPRQRLQTILNRDLYTRDRRPPEGSWTISGDLVIVGTTQMGSAKLRSEIPDWILDDTATVGAQIALNLGEAENFIGRELRRRWWKFGR